MTEKWNASFEEEHVFWKEKDDPMGWWHRTLVADVGFPRVFSLGCAILFTIIFKIFVQYCKGYVNYGHKVPQVILSLGFRLNGPCMCRGTQDEATAYVAIPILMMYTCQRKDLLRS